MTDILVVGSLAYDDVETPFERRSGVLGGAAAYFALAARCYGQVRLVGVVGEDFREEDIERLRRAGVDLGGLERRAGRSFRWLGRYDYDLATAQTLNTDLGVFAEWRPSVPERFRDAPFVFLANIHPEIQLDLLDQVRKPELVALDSMNYWIESQREALGRVLARVHLVCLNDAEVRQLCGTPSIIAAARTILAHGPRALVVKRGEHGATLFTREGMFWSPAYPLEQVRDPTGAGDSFAGGLLGQLARNGGAARGLRRAVVHGAVCASFAVETFSVDGVEAANAELIADRYARLRQLVELGAEEMAAAAAPAP